MGAGVLIAGTFLGASLAQAQTRDPAGAEKLYDDGSKLLEANDWPGACAKFEASFKLDPSAGTQLRLASCAEHDGKLALAWLRLKEARLLSADTKSEAQKKQMEAFITASLERLEPRLPYLTVTVPDVPDAIILRNGQAVVTGAELPIDPGKHTLVVSAPGYVEQSKEIVAVEGQKQSIEVRLVKEDPKVVPPEDPKKDPIAPPKKDPEKPPVTTEGGGLGGVQIGGIIVGSVGLATLGASFVLGGVALGKQSDLDALGCTETEGGLDCAPADRATAAELSSDGSTLALASTVTTFVGAAALGAGVLMLALGGPAEAEATALVVPLAGPGFAGVGVTGVFQ